MIGSRFAGTIETMHAHRRFGNRVLTASWRCSLVRRTSPTARAATARFPPPRPATREVIHDYNYAQVLTLDLVRKGYRYAEVPISYSFRTEGRSFVRLVPYLRHVVPAVWRELRSSIAVRMRPSHGRRSEGARLLAHRFRSEVMVEGKTATYLVRAGEGRGAARPEEAPAGDGSQWGLTPFERRSRYTATSSSFP